MTDMPSDLLDFETELANLLAVPAPDETFSARLRMELLRQPQKKIRPTRLLWRIALVLPVLLVIVALILGPRNVLAAFKRWFGYLPGIGLVQNAADLRLLTEPAVLERDGVRVTIENAAADSERTILVYRIEGLSVAAANSQGEGAPTGSIPTLVTGEGAVLTSNEASGTGWATGYQMRAVFPALPAGADHAVLFFHRLPGMPEGAAPQDWSIPFDLAPAPAELQVMPVYEIVSPTPQPTPSTEAAAADSTQSLAEYGVSLTLDTIITLADGYQFQGYATWPEDGGIEYVTINPYEIHLASAGTEIKVEPADPDLQADQGSPNHVAWAVRTQTRTFPGPVSITFDSVEVTRTVNAPFTLDLGPNPSVGQLITADQTISVAESTIHLNGYQISTLADGSSNLDLFFDAARPIYALFYQDPENYLTNQGGGGGGGGGIPPAEGISSFQSSFHYGRVPTGLRNLTVTSFMVALPSDQPIIWQPPAEAISDAPPAALPQACLTQSTWQSLTDRQQSLPEGIGGKILLQQFVTGQPMPRLVIVELVSGAQREIDYGAWSSLSPDGSLLAYVRSQGEGIYVADAASGQTRLVPGTQSSDYNPIWSPDGQWIVFFRGGSAYDYYRIRPDGSELTPVYHSALLSQVDAWNPADGRLIFETLTDQGIVLQSVDPAGSDVRDLLVTGLRKPVAYTRISSDGSLLAYRGFEFGDPDFSLIVSAPDGSSKQILADASLTVLPAAWSSDNRWLLATVVYQQDTKQIQQPVLIEPQTCQVVSLTGLSGQVTGWSP